jgi:hypothetical protein
MRRESPVTNDECDTFPHTHQNCCQLSCQQCSTPHNQHVSSHTHQHMPLHHKWMCQNIPMCAYAYCKPSHSLNPAWSGAHKSWVNLLIHGTPATCTPVIWQPAAQACCHPFKCWCVTSHGEPPACMSTIWPAPIPCHPNHELPRPTLSPPKIDMAPYTHTPTTCTPTVGPTPACSPSGEACMPAKPMGKTAPHASDTCPITLFLKPGTKWISVSCWKPQVHAFSVWQPC